nr:WhiB-family transcriptional regulator [Saccharopolyspora endophytica]
MQQRINRHDALYKLLTNLPGADLGVAPECAETDPEVFFPEPGRVDLARQAIEICERCPVRDACLELAVRDGEWGIWGGMTEGRRRKIRAERRLASQDQEAA